MSYLVHKEASGLQQWPRQVFWQELQSPNEEKLKSLLMNVKEESEKASLKFNIQKTKIMASSPITSRKVDRETMETVRDFIFLGSKITAVDDCSHVIQVTCYLEEKLWPT